MELTIRKQHHAHPETHMA